MSTKPASFENISIFKSVNNYFPIQLDFFALDHVCNHNIYLKSGDIFVLYRSANLPFTSAEKERLKISKNHVVFIHCNTEQDLQAFYQDNLSTIIQSKEIKSDEKAKVLHYCATALAKELFNNIDPKRSLMKARTVVDSTINYLIEDRENLSKLVLLSQKDSYIFSHCVNVLTLTITLMTALKIKEPQILKDAGLGAIFHDIGKSKISSQILDKPGPLTNDEWTLMKQHPQLGAEILSQGSGSERARSIVSQHHERMDGNGYPKGLAGADISIPSRVVAICDTYDAMTSNRPYQKAISPLETFRLLMRSYKTSYDQNILVTLIQSLNLK